MTQHFLIQTIFSLMLIVTSLSACTERKEGRPTKLIDTFPDIVSSVNGVNITRTTIAERFDQAMSMMAHTQHMERMPPPTPSSGNEPAATSTPPPTSDLTHSQHTDNIDETTVLRTIINQLVLEQLKLQEVQRLGLTVSPEVLEENVQAIEKQVGSREILEEQLRQGHATVEQWRTQLRQALLFQQLSEHRRKALPVSNEDVRQYWADNRNTLSKLWKTDRLNLVQDRIRGLIQEARWPEAETRWQNELVKKATIWVDPTVRRHFASPADHTHSEQGDNTKRARAGRG